MLLEAYTQFVSKVEQKPKESVEDAKKWLMGQLLQQGFQVGPLLGKRPIGINASIQRPSLPYLHIYFMGHLNCVLPLCPDICLDPQPKNSSTGDNPRLIAFPSPNLFSRSSEDFLGRCPFWFSLNQHDKRHRSADWQRLYMQVYIDRLKVLYHEASNDPQSPAHRELHDLIVMRVHLCTIPHCSQ